MRKKDWEEANEEFDKFTHEDYKKLRAGMAMYKLARVNGRVCGSWEQYMQELNVLRVEEDKSITVLDPYNYTRYNKARVMMESLDAKDQDSFFKTNPREKEKWKETVDKWNKEIREMLRSVDKKI